MASLPEFLYSQPQTEPFNRDNAFDRGTGRSPARDEFKRLDKHVQVNEWPKAFQCLWPTLSLLPSEIETDSTGELSLEAARAIKNVVRVGEYFEQFKDPKFDWLNEYLQKTLQRIDFHKTVDVQELQMALGHVQIEFRRKPWDLDACQTVLERVFEAIQSGRVLIGGTPIVTDTYKSSREAIEAYSFQSRLNYVAHQIALANQDLSAAEEYLELADHFLKLHANAEAKEGLRTAVHTTYLGFSHVDLSRVFLRILVGSYDHALKFQQTISTNLKDSDPRGRLRAKLAEAVCRRCLNADSDSELAAVDVLLSETIETFKDHFPNGRLRLRLFYERALTTLLRIGLQARDDQRHALIVDLEWKIEFMKDYFSQATGRRRNEDLAWAVQIGLLEARLYLHHGDIGEARSKAEIALEKIDRTPLKLLQIQARIALAVVEFRDKRFDRATELLTAAMERNTETKLVHESADFTQPELAATTLLYFARVSIRMKDLEKAAHYMAEYGKIGPQIRNAWITNRLLVEVEDEIMSVMIGKTGVRVHDDDLQKRLSRKNQIESAAKYLRSGNVTKISRQIGISTQTFYNWVRDLEQGGLRPEVPGGGFLLGKGDRLRKTKAEIEAAYQAVGLANKSELARYLKISRQALYSRLSELEKAGLSPKAPNTETDPESD